MLIGQNIRIWGMDLRVKKAYRMFLLSTFQFPGITELLILWNFGVSEVIEASIPDLFFIVISIYDKFLMITSKM